MSKCDLVRNVLGSDFFLVVVGSKKGRVSKVIVGNEKRVDLCLYAVFPGKGFQAVLSVALSRRRTIELARAFKETIPNFLMRLRLFLAVTHPVCITFGDQSFRGAEYRGAFYFRGMGSLNG